MNRFISLLLLLLVYVASAEARGHYTNTEIDGPMRHLIDSWRMRPITPAWDRSDLSCFIYSWHTHSIVNKCRYPYSY